jgi:hypothetical protein
MTTQLRAVRKEEQPKHTDNCRGNTNPNQRYWTKDLKKNRVREAGNCDKCHDRSCGENPMASFHEVNPEGWYSLFISSTSSPCASPYFLTTQMFR